MKILFALLVSPIPATCQVQRGLLDFTIVTKLGEGKGKAVPVLN